MEDSYLNTIKIGFKSYKIEKPKDIVEVKGSYYGTIDHDSEVIKVADRFNQNDKNCTFIHEVLHGICARFGLSEIDRDEHAIDLLATGIYEVILDNPHIFKMTDI